jgi:CDP-paratose 2-epimerase
MLEAIARFEELFGRTLDYELLEEPRRGDHICYITNLARFRADYPEWEIEVPLDDVFESFVGATPVTS